MNKKFSVSNSYGNLICSISADSLKKAVEKFSNDNNFDIVMIDGHNLYTETGAFYFKDITDTKKEMSLDIAIIDKKTEKTNFLTVTKNEWFFLYEEMGLFEYNGYVFICDTNEKTVIANPYDLYAYIDDIDYSEILEWFPILWKK